MGQTRKQLPEHNDGKTLRGDDIDPRAHRQLPIWWKCTLSRSPLPEITNLEDNQVNSGGSDVIVV